LAFYLTSRIEPVNRETLTPEKLALALSAQYFYLEEEFHQLGASWSKRISEGVWAYFENGNLLPSLVNLRQGLIERDWEGTGTADLRVALHAAPPEKILRNTLGPSLDHARALLDAAPRGQILLTEEAKGELTEPEGFVFQDMGPHLLNDLLEPRKVFVLKPKGRPTGEAPLLTSLKVLSQNLPAQGVPFLGREEEIESIIQNLGMPDKRLITLVGPGGFGKTRLALQAAARLTHCFPDGVYFVGLAPLSSARFMVESLGQALKIVFTGGGDAERQMLNYLQEKRLLLIMDNFEHVLEGVDLVSHILREAPRTAILATSRERLKLEEETVMEIKGLSYPLSMDADDPENYAAVRLFLRHAQRVVPHWEASPEDKHGIGRLSRVLEGMPLGLELSASWLKSLAPDLIADKIESNRDFLAAEMPFLPARQQSLRAVFEYSWVLLNEAQKKALCAASVFKGGFSPQAAAQVAGVAPVVFKELALKFLVRNKPNGYLELHDLLKFYSKEKLFKDQAEKERVMDAHSVYLARELRRHEKDLWGAKQSQTLAYLMDEIGNIREGWRRALEQGNENWMGDYLDCLFALYETKGWYQEGVEAFQGAVEALSAKGLGKKASRSTRVLTGKLMARWGVLLQRKGELQKAKRIFEESLALLEKEHADKEAAFSCSGLGLVMESLGRDDQAITHYRDSYRLYHKVREKIGMAFAQNNLGHIALHLGNYYEGQKYLRKAMAYYESTGYQGGAANSYNLMGDILHELSDYEQARYYYQKGLSAFVACGDRKGVAWSFNNLGRSIESVGNFEGAREMFKEGLKLHEEFGDKRAVGWSHNLMAGVLWAMGDYDSASQHAKTGLDHYIQVGDPRGQTWALDLLGNLAVAQRRFDEARMFYERGRQIQEKGDVKPFNLSWFAYHRGALFLAEGKISQAHRHLETALEQFKRRSDTIGIVAALILLAEVGLEMARVSQARKHLIDAFDRALSAHIGPHLVDAMVALAKYTKALGDERNAFAFLALAIHHPNCRRETKDKIVRFVQHLESHLPQQEVRDIVQWARAARIEDVARDWLLSVKQRTPKKASRGPKEKIKIRGKRKK
jgi:predicted ATPase